MCNSNNITFDQVRASMKAAGITIAHSEGGDFYVIPSATALNKTYTVFLSATGPLCSCPNGGRSCWHGKRALELAAQAAQAPARPKVAYAAAMDDLFGRKVA